MTSSRRSSSAAAAAAPAEAIRERPGLVRSLAVRLFVAFALAFLTLYAYWGINLYRSLDAQIHQRAETLMEERRTFIRTVVEAAVHAADHQRHTIEARLRRTLRERVKRALDLAENLWRARAPDATDAAVRAAIREALRPVRYNGGRGYFYIFDMETGEGILHADMPDLEGTDLRTVRDPDGRPIVPRMIEMLREKREGFYTYFWGHPNKPGDRHLKIAYAALFDPLGLGIACGDYVEDMTADIKAETLEQLEAMAFGNGGYIFAGTWDGVSLLGPVWERGRNVWEVEDPNGVKVVRDLVAAARAGGGFVSYVLPVADEETEPQHKLSYVLPVPEWKWYVGAGVSIDDINASIAEIGATMRRDALNDLILGTALMAIMTGASYLIALQSARRVGAEVRRIETFLEDDGRHPELLNPDDARFGEGRRLAIAVRAMAARRDAAEAALERQTESLEKSNADLERFAYVASHDLREPLRIISSYVGLLRRRYRGRLDADADTFIDYAADGAQRMHDMIGDLLEYARVKTSDTPFTTVPLDRVLGQARSNLTRRIRDIDAVVEIPDGLPSVRGKESLLVSLFQNLMENALKYRHPDRRPQVRVSSRIEAEACVISVTDNGLGIDPAFHDRIFRIFQRLHPGGTYPGTGVGLSICQSIAETHDGRIWVDSEPDIGSVFHVSLPLGPSRRVT